jgi:hypothetical protein
MTVLRSTVLCAVYLSGMGNSPLSCLGGLRKYPEIPESERLKQKGAMMNDLFSAVAVGNESVNRNKINYITLCSYFPI